MKSAVQVSVAEELGRHQAQEFGRLMQQRDDDMQASYIMGWNAGSSGRLLCLIGGLVAGVAVGVAAVALW